MAKSFGGAVRTRGVGGWVARGMMGGFLMFVAGAVLPAAAADVGDSWSTAQPLSLGATGYSSSLEQYRDVDFYSVTLTAGTSYAFQVKRTDDGGTDGDFALRLHGTDGTTVLLTRAVALSWTPAVSGTYYLAVGGSYDCAKGAYKVTAVSYTGDDRPNLPVFGGTPVIPGDPAPTGTFEVAGDRDFFRVEAPANGCYRLTPSGAADQIAVYDAAGTRLTEGSSVTVTVPASPVTSVYYVEVWSASGATGAYSWAGRALTPVNLRADSVTVAPAEVADGFQLETPKSPPCPMASAPSSSCTAVSSRDSSSGRT